MNRCLLSLLIGSTLFCATLAGGAAQNAKPDVAVPDIRSSFEETIRLYQADALGLARFFDLPWSGVRFERLEKLYQEWQKQLGAANFDQLEQQGRIDYLLLRNRLTAELDQLTIERRRLAEMEEVFAWRAPIQELERTRWRMEPLNPQPAAEVVAALPAQLKQLRKRLEAGKKSEKKDEKSKETTSGASTNETKELKPADATAAAGDAEAPAPLKTSPLIAKRAAEAADEVRGTLRTWYSYYDGFQPDFSWWLKKPYEEANQALEEFSKFLREEIAGIKGKDEDPLLGEPLGPEMLGKALASEMLPYSASELIAIGETEFAWCETEMRKAAAAVGYSNDWKAALAKVKADYVPPGKQDDLVAACGREAIQYVKDHDLVTVPSLCEETWRITMLTPERQKTLPYAAYGGQVVQVAYAKDDMKQEDKVMAMRGNNRHFTRIVVAHELIPGHHLQAFESARHHPYRSMFSTPFLVEGWSLYWELMLWERNYAQSPEDRIGMLFWRMHRCARIIVSLKFHLGEMKPKEMVDFLVDRVGHEKLGATSEVRRFIGSAYSPQYQCGYLIGGMQLRALRQEVVTSGKMTERQFNDAVLTYGPIPIELIRAGILNVTLSRDMRSSWKFAGQPAVKNGSP